MFGFLFGFPFLLVGFCVYFLPTIVAMSRQKTNLTAIALVNFFLGWSVIGWFVALVWAVSTERVDQVRYAGTVLPAQSQSRFCPSCGKSDGPGARFCAHCRVALS
jgi:hypothetical protein